MDAQDRRMHNMNVLIRYLEQWEKQDTRNLYETAFSEDSREFVDYYYHWKIRDNEIIVMEEEQPLRGGFFHVMIHQNPYMIWINGRKERIPYLVAVATDPVCRRQGKMNQVMRRLLQDLGRNKTPFTFLLPADPAYYEGQGFIFFPDMALTGIQDEAKRGMIQAAEAQISYMTARSSIKWQQAGETDIAEMAAFSNRVLRERHDVVISRDRYYYQRLLAETAVEHGGILLWRHAGDLRGMLTYALTVNSQGQSQGRYRAEIKELLLEEYVSEEEGRKICQNALQKAGVTGKRSLEVEFSFEKMMVRITSLTAVVPLLKSQKRRSFHVKVSDPVIEANNGCFRITLDWDGGSIRQIPEEEVTENMDIARLTQELWKDVSVYLNEWV